MKCRVGLLCILVAAPLVLLPDRVQAQPRTEVLLNDGWRFVRQNPAGAERVDYNDDRWEQISLPHTWNAFDGQDGGNDYYRGTGWYRKHLALDSRYHGKSIFVKFDGAATSTQVYVNGALAGTHKGNYGAFCFDISALVRFDGPNTIAVKVNNARDTTVAPLRGDFTVFGGIYRAVRLLILEDLSVSPLDYASSGVYVKQVRVSTAAAELEVTTVVRNASGQEKKAVLRCSIADRDGRTVVSLESGLVAGAGSQRNEVQNLTVPKPHLWNGRPDPYMYQVTVELLDRGTVKDHVTQPLGLRSFTIDADQGFSLNGKPYPLHGVNRHQDRENMGSAIGIKEHREDYARIEEMGCSAVRLAHYQQAQEFYDLADRGGMIVWAELALVDDIHPSAAFAENCKEQLKELIKQNYNHPSILFWSMYNELVPEPDRELYGKVVSDLNVLAKQLDPTRLTAMASRSKYGGDEFINTVTDVIGYNVYRGWYEGKPEGFAAFADTLHRRFPRLRVAITEYGAGASIAQHEYPPGKPNTKGPWHPEEWQTLLHETTWNAMASRPYLWGTFVWNMFDFASDGRAEGDMPGRNDKGLVTFDRKVNKDAFYWYKAQWNPQPMVHITAKRHTPRPDGPGDIKVYANCDSVTLLVNGRPRGTKTSVDKRFVWSDIDMLNGRNTIEAIGFTGAATVRDTCSWLALPIEKPRGTSSTETRSIK
jgi:beta-galactosidase